MQNETMIYSHRWFLFLCAGFGLFIAAYSVGIYSSTEEGWLELPSGLVVKKHYVFGLCVSKIKEDYFQKVLARISYKGKKSKAKMHRLYCKSLFRDKRTALKNMEYFLSAKNAAEDYVAKAITKDKAFVIIESKLDKIR